MPTVAVLATSGYRPGQARPNSAARQHNFFCFLPGQIYPRRYPPARYLFGCPSRLRLNWAAQPQKKIFFFFAMRPGVALSGQSRPSQSWQDRTAWPQKKKFLTARSNLATSATILSSRPGQPRATKFFYFFCCAVGFGRAAVTLSATLASRSQGFFFCCAAGFDRRRSGLAVQVDLTFSRPDLVWGGLSQRHDDG